MQQRTIILLLTLALIIFMYCMLRNAQTPKQENYVDPIITDPDVLQDVWYPNTNGSIYGIGSDIFSGYPYYDKAY